MCFPEGNKHIKQYFKKWRPITLLNPLYKIISGHLSHRIKDTLDNVFSETSSAFLKGRYVGKNTGIIYDLLSLKTALPYISGFLVFVDFEKKRFILCHGLLLLNFQNSLALVKYIFVWVNILNTKHRA